VATPFSLAPVLAVRSAIVGHGALVALVLTAKSTRDALFCASFSPSELPKAMVAGSLLTACLALVTGAFLRKRGPITVLPTLLAINAVLFLLERHFVRTAPGPGTLALYLHVSAVTGVLLSAFWSSVNESFDPYQLRGVVGKITLGGTVGGIAGGALAERIARWAEPRDALFVPAVMCAITALAINTLGATTRENVASNASPAPARALPASYVSELAAFIGLGALSASLVDFAFKARAMETLHDPASLVGLFALFYGVTSAASFLVQMFLTPWVLDRFGLGVGLAVTPGSIALSALAAVVAPGLFTQGLAKGAETTFAASVHRSAYEPLYAPLAPSQKRAAKGVIDVLVNRLGDALGSLLAWALVLALPTLATRAATGAAFVAAACTWWFSGRLRRGYVAELAESLRVGAVHIDARTVSDKTTRFTLSRALELREGEAKTTAERALGASPLGGRADGAGADEARADEAGRIVTEILAADLATVARGLERAGPRHASFVASLLNSVVLAPLAVRHLTRLGAAASGALAAALFDPEMSARARLEAARALGKNGPKWCGAPLTAALADPDEAVRREAARALEEMARRGQHAPLDTETAIELALHELRAGKGWDHVEQALRVLGLAQDPDAFQLARRALRSQDPKVRGTGLEYLMNVLPPRLRGEFVDVLSIVPHRSERTAADLLKELRNSMVHGTSDGPVASRSDPSTG
jgi:ATP/ADP translocase